MRANATRAQREGWGFTHLVLDEGRAWVRQRGSAPPAAWRFASPRALEFAVAVKEEESDDAGWDRPRGDTDDEAAAQGADAVDDAGGQWP
jgi:hypothetical protein